MSTPLSNSVSYCTPATFLLRYDARRVGDLLLDIGERAEAEAVLSGSQLPADSVTQHFLDDAAGMVEAACQFGQRYSPTDLAGLTGVSQKFLWGLIADLAFWGLLCRRKECDPTPRAKLALATLEALRDGQLIFGILEVAEAGVPAAPFQVDTDLANQGLATRQARRMFGDRAGWNRPSSAGFGAYAGGSGY